MKTKCGNWHKQRKGRTSKCEGCDGSGVRAPALPSCEIDDIPRGWCVIEKCDTCDTYFDDLVAAFSVSLEQPRWVLCRNGGEHAIGRLE